MTSGSRPGRIVLLAILAAGMVSAGINEWTNAGPEGLGATFLVFDPQDPATLYTGTGVGLFKSTDGGASWTNTGLIGWGVGGLVIDPLNSSTLYAVTEFFADDDFDTTKVFKSTDGGSTWNESDSGLPAQSSVQFLPISSQNTATLYALTGEFPRGLFKSADGAATWAKTSGLPGNLSFVDVKVDSQNSNTLYAAAQGADAAGHPVVAVYKSMDGGASWKESDSGLPGAGSGLTPFVPQGALVVDPLNPNAVYVTRFGIGVYKTADGGASWHAANSGLPNLVGDYEFMSCCVSGAIIDPQNPSTLYAQGAYTGLIYKTTDGGANWKSVGTLGIGASQGSLTIDPHTSTLYTPPVSREGSGILKSADGGATWSVVYFALRDIPVSSLAIDPQTSGTVYAGAWKSTDSGMSWSAANMSFGSSVGAMAIDPTAPGTLYAGISEHKVDDGDTLPCASSSVAGIFKSVDGGMNWMDTQIGFGCIFAIAIDPQNPTTVYAGSQYNGVYKSTDGGTSWGAVNSGLPGALRGLSVSALAIDPKNSGTVYAGSGAGLFKSTDGGATWSDAGLAPLAYALAIDPQNTSTMFAATTNGLFKTTDSGATWLYVFPLSQADVYAVAIDPRKSGTIYAGSDNGLAQSADGGITWTPIPVAPGRIRLLALDPQDPNTVYAGGPAGLYSISLGANQTGAGESALKKQ